MLHNDEGAEIFHIRTVFAFKRSRSLAMVAYRLFSVEITLMRPLLVQYIPYFNATVYV